MLEKKSLHIEKNMCSALCSDLWLYYLFIRCAMWNGIEISPNLDCSIRGHGRTIASTTYRYVEIVIEHRAYVIRATETASTIVLSR